MSDAAVNAAARAKFRRERTTGHAIIRRAVAAPATKAAAVMAFRNGTKG
jgi:hypothetical protein